MKLIILIVLAFSSTIESTSLFLDLDAKNPDWNNLKVTWGLNPFSPSYFVAMPRTESDARAQGWTREKSCPEVNGNRYVFMGDRAVILIFNMFGDIAGIATALPKG